MESERRQQLGRWISEEINPDIINKLKYLKRCL
jgi:hypothetical protein